jgi:hypothetical protein
MRTVAPPDQARITSLLSREEDRFAREHPKSIALSARARESLLAGVPMNWMVRWAEIDAWARMDRRRTHANRPSRPAG